MLDIPPDSLEGMSLQIMESVREDLEQSDRDKVISRINSHMIGTYSFVCPLREASCYLCLS